MGGPGWNPFSKMNRGMHVVGIFGSNSGELYVHACLDNALCNVSFCANVLLFRHPNPNAPPIRPVVIHI